MADVSLLNSALRSNLLTLNRTQNLIDETTKRLATGLKVSSALDGPSNFFNAQALSNRADDLARRLDGIGQGIRTLEETQNGIDASLELLDLAEAYLVDIEERYRAGEIVVQNGAPSNVTALQPGATDFIGYAGSQDSGGPVVVTNGGNDFELTGNLWKRLFVDYTITPDTVLEFEYASTVIPEISSIGFDNDNSFTNNNDRFFLNGTQLGGISYAVPTGTYQYTGGGAYETYSIPVGTFFTGNFDYITFINDDDSNPTGNSFFRNVTLREGPIEFSSAAPDSLMEGYNAILEQLDNLVEDASYRGVQLLRDDDLNVLFNEDGTSHLLTEGIDGTSAGLGIRADNLDSIEAAQLRLQSIRDARETLRRYSATLALDYNILQMRETFTRETINTLLSGADDLTVANQNEEGANILALQTRQTLGVTALSLAAQSARSILSLFA